MIISIQNRKKE